MIRINFQEPNNDNWRNWKTECNEEQQAHSEAIEAGQTSKVNDRVYKGVTCNIKPDVYMNLHGPFHGKCAYCESLIKADQPGDIEHFRPQNAVKNKDGNDEMVNVNGELKPHPGYYWLAYNFQNLLPSCRDCNKIPKKNDPQSYGKGNQFPVKDFRALKQGEEEREEALLINPVFEDPAEHLKLDKTGAFNALTDQGQACIDIFGLNIREALVESRKNFYDSVKNDVDMLIIHLINRSNEVKKRLGKIKDIWEGKGAYSVAGLLAIEERSPVLRTIFELKDSA